MEGCAQPNEQAQGPIACNVFHMVSQVTLSHSTKGIKGLMNCIYKPCLNGMPLARWRYQIQTVHPFQSQKNCQCVSCAKVLQRDWTTLCSAADTWSNHIAAPCDTLSIDNSPWPFPFCRSASGLQDYACRNSGNHNICNAASKDPVSTRNSSMTSSSSQDYTFCLPDVTWQHLPCFLSLLYANKKG